MPSHSIFLIPGETVHHAPNADLSCPVPWYRPAQSKDSSYGMHTVEFLTSEEGICAANPKYTLPAASSLRISHPGRRIHTGEQSQRRDRNHSGHAWTKRDCKHSLKYIMPYMGTQQQN